MTSILLHDELLSQAFDLARLNPGACLQANLRRSVSSAYYALFHLLNHSTAEIFSRNFQASDEVAVKLRRAFDHSQMRTVCRSFSGNSSNVPHVFRELLYGPLSCELNEVASVFVDMQQHRHDADYNLSMIFKEQDVLIKVKRVDHAFSSWRSVIATQNAQALMFALLTGKSLRS